MKKDFFGQGEKISIFLYVSIIRTYVETYVRTWNLYQKINLGNKPRNFLRAVDLKKTFMCEVEMGDKSGIRVTAYARIHTRSELCICVCVWPPRCLIIIR